RLVLRFPVRIDQLQNGRNAVVVLHSNRVARRALWIRLAQTQAPFLCGLREELRKLLEPDAVRQTGVGHRYAFACRFASDGSFARMSRRCARSSSAVITVCSSGACARTIPHGSAISERPYAGLPGSVSPVCAAAATKYWFSIARARNSTCQWSFPVGVVKCAGTVTSSAPSSARMR